jgi:hypothetical protein
VLLLWQLWLLLPLLLLLLRWLLQLAGRSSILIPGAASPSLASHGLFLR